MSHPPHVLGESVRSLGAQRIGKQTEIEREHVGGLRVRRQPRRQCDVFALERRANVLEQGPIIPRVVGASQHLGGSCQKIR